MGREPVLILFYYIFLVCVIVSLRIVFSHCYYLFVSTMTMQTQPPPRQLAATQDVKSLLTTRWRQYITSPSSARLALSAQPYSGLSGVVAAVATQEQQSSALEQLIRQLGKLDISGSSEK